MCIHAHTCMYVSALVCTLWYINQGQNTEGSNLGQRPQDLVPSCQSLLPHFHCPHSNPSMQSFWMLTPVKKCMCYELLPM